MQPGDLLLCDKGLFKHVGVVVINGILHNTPEKGEHISTLFDFCRGRPYRLIEVPIGLRQLIVANASWIAAYPRRFDAISNNCEHTATRALGRKPHSPTVAALFTVAIGAALVYLMLRGR